jgi:hypothetical protein
MFGLDIGNLKDILTRNPLEYGDALGLTYGPLSGRAPGKLTDAGLDLQGKLNPGVSRTALDSANQIAPWVAAAIATFGGSSGGLLGGSGSGAAQMPAAVPESASTLSNWGMTSTSPGVWEAGPYTPKGMGPMDYFRMGNMGSNMSQQSGGLLQQGAHRAADDEWRYPAGLLGRTLYNY